MRARAASRPEVGLAASLTGTSLVQVINCAARAPVAIQMKVRGIHTFEVGAASAPDDVDGVTGHTWCTVSKKPEN